MKLGIVTHKVIQGDGQGRVNYEVAWEAIRRGHQVTLLASQVAIDLQQHCQVDWVNIPVNGLPTVLLRNGAFSWRSTRWLRKHHSKIDLLKVNGAVARFPGDVNAAHFVHSAWQRSPLHPFRVRHDGYGLYQWLYTALNARWEKKAFAEAKVVVAVSEQVKQELVAIGISPEQIRVIINGVDCHEFFPACGDRSAFGLPEHVSLALFVGDIRSNRKNLDTVLRALVNVSSLHLVVVGAIDGSPYPQLADTLGVSDRVQFLGYRPDVSKIMQAVDLFVFPSRYDPFGMVVSEAMASGLPVVTAASAGVAKLVTPECGVVLAEAEDAEAMAAVLAKLAQDPALRRRLGMAGRAIALDHSWRSKAQSYVDLFEELVKP